MIVAIVPAYNEGQRIAHVVSTLSPVVDRVVVIDDCSHDDTSAMARGAGATVLRHHLNRGQGAALETGHAFARGIGAEYVVHFDGDGQFDATEITKALTHLQESEADILFGSRFLQEEHRMPWFKRWVLHPIARLIDRLLGAVRLSDVHNGFRILNKRALHKIYIEQDRMAHASEIPQQVKKHNLTYVEFPVTVTYHEYGQSSVAGFAIIRDLLLKRL